MLKRTKDAGAAATDRATALVDTMRPIVQRAINDPELHEALRQAFNTGRDVTGEVKGKSPRKAARKIAGDRKLQRRVESSAHDLQSAVSGVVEGKRRKGKLRRAFGAIAIVGGIAGAVVIVMRKLKGDDQDPYGPRS